MRFIEVEPEYATRPVKASIAVVAIVAVHQNSGRSGARIEYKVGGERREMLVLDEYHTLMRRLEEE